MVEISQARCSDNVPGDRVVDRSAQREAVHSPLIGAPLAQRPNSSMRLSATRPCSVAASADPSWTFHPSTFIFAMPPWLIVSCALVNLPRTRLAQLCDAAPFSTLSLTGQHFFRSGLFGKLHICPS